MQELFSPRRREIFEITRSFCHAKAQISTKEFHAKLAREQRRDFFAMFHRNILSLVRNVILRIVPSERMVRDSHEFTNFFHRGEERFLRLRGVFATKARLVCHEGAKAQRITKFL